MAEIRVEAVPIGIKYKCDSCGKGYMTRQDVVSENSILLSNPPKFRHSCINCGAVDYFFETYPTIRYEIKEEEE